MEAIIKLQLIIFMIIGSLPLINNPTQEMFEKEVAIKNGQAIKLDLKFASDIKIKTWNQQKLYIKAIVEHNFEEELDFKLLEFNENDEVQIEEKIKNLEDRKNKNFNNNNYDQNCTKLDIKYEIHLPANSELAVNSISGNIEAKSMENSLTLETISGFVDVTLDASKKYYFNARTISGSIYSNLNFDSNESIKSDIVGSKLNTSINGGGKKINLKSISGDLYIRKR